MCFRHFLINVKRKTLLVELVYSSVMSQQPNNNYRRALGLSDLNTCKFSVYVGESFLHVVSNNSAMKVNILIILFFVYNINSKHIPIEKMDKLITINVSFYFKFVFERLKNMLIFSKIIANYIKTVERGNAYRNIDDYFI